MNDQEKCCAIVIDEMSLKESLVYNASMDCVEGFEDHGVSGKTCYVANHACVFMVRG